MNDCGVLHSPCVCNTLRMATRVVTQLYDDVLRPSGLRVTQYSILAALARLKEARVGQLSEALAIDQTTLTRSIGLLERAALVERVPDPDRRVKAVRLTAKGRGALDGARPLWAQAQARVLRELGTEAWAAAKRRLTRLLHVAVKKREQGRTRRRGQPSGAPRRARGTAR